MSQCCRPAKLARKASCAGATGLLEQLATDALASGPSLRDPGLTHPRGKKRPAQTPAILPRAICNFQRPDFVGVNFPTQAAAPIKILYLKILGLGRRFWIVRCGELCRTRLERCRYCEPKQRPERPTVDFPADRSDLITTFERRARLAAPPSFLSKRLIQSNVAT